MKIAVDDKCGEVFKQLKFEKIYRYVIFKIEHEKIVRYKTCSLLTGQVRELKLGTSYYTGFLRMNTDSQSLIFSSKLTTVSTAPKSFS